jgi:hypothetical protein
LKKALALVATLLALAASAGAAGEVLYRWVDERGNQVNSDRPPPSGIEYETISTSSDMVRTVETEGEEAAPTASKPAPGKEKEAVYEDTRRVVIEKNPEYCAQAKNNLEQIDTTARIRLREANGEWRYLSMEERAVEREKALAAIDAYCE